jgi:quercetin dioxygenase-like cupin family protein
MHPSSASNCEGRLLHTGQQATTQLHTGHYLLYIANSERFLSGTQEVSRGMQARAHIEFQQIYEPANTQHAASALPSSLFMLLPAITKPTSPAKHHKGRNDTRLNRASFKL